MRKRIAALFMAAILCAGMADMPAMAAGMTIPDEQTILDETADTAESEEMVAEEAAQTVNVPDAAADMEIPEEDIDENVPADMTDSIDESVPADIPADGIDEPDANEADEPDEAGTEETVTEEEDVDAISPLSADGAGEKAARLEVDGTATEYETVQAAINAVSKSSCTITLLKDVTEDINFNFTYGNDKRYTIIFDLNGCVLTGAVTNTNAYLAIGDKTQGHTGQITGNITNADAQSADYAAITLILSGHFKGTLTRGTNTGLYTNGGFYVNEPAGFVQEGYIAQKITADEHGCMYHVQEDQMAKIVRDGQEIIYNSLTNAISGAQPGETVILLKDIDGNSIYRITKSITLDLNGCTVRSKKACVFYAYPTKEEISVTIKNGTIDLPIANTIGAVFVEKQVNLTIDNVQMSSSYGVRAGNADLINPTVTIKGEKTHIHGEVAGIAAIGGGPSAEAVTLQVEDGTITGKYYGIAGNGSNDNTFILIQGGSVSGGASAIYHPQEGDLTITGGTLTGPNGIQYCSSGKVTISGGVIRATQAYSEYPTKPSDQGDGPAEDGAALALISRGGGYQDAGKTMEVVISGGELISENNAAVAVYRLEQVNGKWVTNGLTNLNNFLGKLEITGGYLKGGSQKGAFEVDDAAKKAVEISGGYFSSDPTKYVIAGKTALEGHWAQSGEDYYFTIDSIIGEIPDDLKIVQAPVKLVEKDTTDMEAADAKLVSTFEEKVKAGSITHGSLSAEAVNLVNGELSSQIESLEKEGMDKLKPTPDQTMTLYLRPYMDMKVLDADAAKNTLTLDIAVKYDLYASTATSVSGIQEGTNAVLLKEAQVMNNYSSPIEITVPLPDGFQTDGLKVKHIKKNGDKERCYYYTPEVKTDALGNKVAVFTNPNGFSTFILMTDKRSATVEYQMADGTKQTVTYTADDVGVTKLPADSKKQHTFVGWKFPGDDSVYGPSELTDDLLDKLAAAGSTITAVPEFAAVTATIDITKEVLDHNGKALKMKTSFYAAVFTDKNCTVRYGQVTELKLEDASHAAASVTVGVPEDGSRITYYVAETDKNGKPVQSGEAFGYEVTLTGSEVTISDGQKAEVHIVNQKIKPKSTKKKKHHSSSDSGQQAVVQQTTAVQTVTPGATNDTTNLLLPILCLILGAGGIGWYAFTRKKKK